MAPIVTTNQYLPPQLQTDNPAEWMYDAADQLLAAIDTQWAINVRNGTPNLPIGLPASWYALGYGDVIPSVHLLENGDASNSLDTMLRSWAASSAAQSDQEAWTALNLRPYPSGSAGSGFQTKPLSVAESELIRMNDHEIAKDYLALAARNAAVRASASSGFGGAGGGGGGGAAGGMSAYESARLAIDQAQLALQEKLGMGGLDLDKLQFEADKAFKQAQMDLSNKQFGLTEQQFAESQRQFNVSREDTLQARQEENAIRAAQLQQQRAATTAQVMANPNDFVQREYFVRPGLSGGQEPQGTPVDIFTGQPAAGGQQMTLSQLLAQQAEKAKPYVVAGMSGKPAPTAPAFAGGTGRITPDGYTTSQRFIAGDSPAGNPFHGGARPEVIKLKMKNGRPAAKVIPLSQMIGPRYAEGTLPSITDPTYMEELRKQSTYTYPGVTEPISTPGTYNYDGTYNAPPEVGYWMGATPYSDTGYVIPTQEQNWNYYGGTSGMTPEQIYQSTVSGYYANDPYSLPGYIPPSGVSSGVTQSVDPNMPNYVAPAGQPPPPSPGPTPTRTGAEWPATPTFSTTNQQGYTVIQAPQTFTYKGGTATLVGDGTEYIGPEGMAYKYDPALKQYVPVSLVPTAIKTPQEFYALPSDVQSQILLGFPTNYFLDSSITLNPDGTIKATNPVAPQITGGFNAGSLPTGTGFFGPAGDQAAVPLPVSGTAGQYQLGDTGIAQPPPPPSQSFTPQQPVISPPAGPQQEGPDTAAATPQLPTMWEGGPGAVDPNNPWVPPPSPVTKPVIPPTPPGIPPPAVGTSPGGTTMPPASSNAFTTGNAYLDALLGPSGLNILSYGNEAYQNLPGLGYLGGGQSQAEYETMGSQDTSVPSLGITLPAPNKLNYERLSYLQSSNPDFFSMLRSLFAAGNRSLDSEMAQLAGRAPRGKVTVPSLVQT